jgi:hypothetical protein
MTFAQLVTDPKNGILAIITDILVPVLMAMCLVAFMWGVINYFLIHGSEEKSRAEGRQFMIWSVLALALMFSLWTVIKFLLSTLGILRV